MAMSDDHNCSQDIMNVATVIDIFPYGDPAWQNIMPYENYSAYF